MILIYVFGEDAIARVLIDFSPVLCRAEFQRLRAAAASDKNPRGLRGFFCDNADHAIHRVGAPHRPARTANHFNAFNIL